MTEDGTICTESWRVELLASGRYLNTATRYTVDDWDADAIPSLHFLLCCVSHRNYFSNDPLETKEHNNGLLENDRHSLTIPAR